jgi:hypothetical protein
MEEENEIQTSVSVNLKNETNLAILKIVGDQKHEERKDQTDEQECEAMMSNNENKERD